MNDTQRRDLDETRRLCYMAVLANRTERYELAGTLVNAFLHHLGGMEAEPEVVMDGVIAAIQGDPDGIAQVMRQAKHITANLETKPQARMRVFDW
jgi:hypothetical protein